MVVISWQQDSPSRVMRERQWFGVSGRGVGLGGAQLQAEPSWKSPSHRNSIEQKQWSKSMHQAYIWRAPIGVRGENGNLE